MDEIYDDLDDILQDAGILGDRDGPDSQIEALKNLLETAYDLLTTRARKTFRNSTDVRALRSDVKEYKEAHAEDYE